MLKQIREAAEKKAAAEKVRAEASEQQVTLMLKEIRLIQGQIEYYKARLDTFPEWNARILKFMEDKDTLVQKCKTLAKHISLPHGFKIGQTVYNQWADGKYDVPLGTRGTVKGPAVDGYKLSKNRIKVEFENGTELYIDWRDLSRTDLQKWAKSRD